MYLTTCDSPGWVTEENKQILKYKPTCVYGDGVKKIRVKKEGYREKERETRRMCKAYKTEWTQPPLS